MYSRSKSDSNASCHSEAVEMEELCSGFLCKSPPSGHLRKMKSWKRRFFELVKTNNGSHELKYYKTAEKDKAIKSIKVSSITLMYVGPELHSTFDWISKTFKCSASSVLFMKAENPTDKVQREYFFIGDNSEEVDKWFNALFKVLKDSKSESQIKPQIKTESTAKIPCDTDKSIVVSGPPVPPRSRSFEVVTTKPDQCCQPPNRNQSETKVCENKESLDETAEESNEEMSSEESGIDSSEDSLMDCVTKVFNNFRTQDKPTESNRHKTQSATTIDNNNKDSCFDFNGNSETHTLFEKEISISPHELKSLVFTEDAGKPCVSQCQQNQVSCLLHEGDQILAVNDLLTDTVEEIHAYLRKLSKNKVKLTIRRTPGSIPLHSEP